MPAKPTNAATPATKKGKERIAFWMDSDLCEKIRAVAFEHNVSQSQIVSDLVAAAQEPTVKRG